MAKAVATKAGFYGAKRVQPGETFEVQDGETGNWFEVEEEEAPKKKRGSSSDTAPSELV
ncbi:hypothetical protein [Asticcacaulis sp.]|uniref:hypothetical protein n=1 Tax=Asticcacaulis sp. TaxID=1872648 RepID=UPI0031D07FC4